MKAPLHVPSAVGRAAVTEAEIDRVRWSDLQNAYGRGPDEGDHADVRAALVDLGAEDEDTSEGAVDCFWGNICHQGTIYEATAHAVPFLAAYVAGDISDESFERTSTLLVHIAFAASFDAPHGSHSGAWGDGVGASTRAAFAASAAHLRKATARHPEFAEAEQAIAKLAASQESKPDAALVEQLKRLAFG